MKTKISLLLTVLLLLVCIFPTSVFAANDTSGSMEVVITVSPPPSPDPDPGNNSGGGGSSSRSSDNGTDNNDDTPAYSYIVNIPTSFEVTGLYGEFSISASKMDIPPDKQLVVRVDSKKTFDPDGLFYLFLDGDKTSEHFILSYIDRLTLDDNMNITYMSSVIGNSIIASFNPGDLQPHDWDGIRISCYPSGQFAGGTYRNTIYYTVELE